VSPTKDVSSAKKSTDQRLWLDELGPGTVVDLTTACGTDYRITVLEGACVCNGYALTPNTKISCMQVSSSVPVWLVTWPLYYVTADRWVEVGRTWQFGRGMRTDEVVVSFKVVE
jgi:hypothetical protein